MNHLVQVALLTSLAVDEQFDRAFGQITGVLDQMQRRARRRIIEYFTDFPRTSLIAIINLQIAAS